jgi:hypothetical protein
MRPKAELFHNEIWFLGHCILLAMMSEREELDAFIDDRKPDISFTMHCAATTSTTLLFRGAWAAARLGKRVLPRYEHILATVDAGHTILDAVVAVLAIGVADESATREARRILENIPTHADERVTETRTTLRDNALAILNDPEKKGRVPAIACGREFLFHMTRELPDGDPYKYADQASIPEDLASTAALVLDVDWHIPEIIGFEFAAIALAISVRAEDFYFPRELSRRVIPDWTPEATLEHAARFKSTVSLELAPARNTVKLGRNDPCFCGSGKKYKKCHGA